MMHSSTPETVKNHILDEFSKSEGHLRVLIATIAYGMGVNCK
jgi:superfamily II DNA helicase RecQ